LAESRRRPVHDGLHSVSNFAARRPHRLRPLHRVASKTAHSGGNFISSKEDSYHADCRVERSYRGLDGRKKPRQVGGVRVPARQTKLNLQ
jgi:hypothetical protein